MNMKKRLLAWLSAVMFCVMGFGIEPLSALAASGEDTPEEPKPVYTITYNFNGMDAAFPEDVTPPATYTQGDSILLRYPVSHDSDSYCFRGWYENSDCTGSAVWSIKPEDTGNKVYYAGWAKIRSITYVLNGGRFPEGYPTKSQLEYTEGTRSAYLPRAGRPGYQFIGWYLTPDFSDEDRFPTHYMKGVGPTLSQNDRGDVTLYARWSKLHTVTFDLEEYGERTGGGELVQSILDGEAAEEPQIKSKTTEYKFAGWDKAFDTVTGDMTVTALWKKKPVYKVTFDLGEYGERVGGGALVQYVLEGEKAKSPTILYWLSAGYEQAGLDKPITTPIMEDTVFTVLWRRTPVVTFDIGEGERTGGGQLVQNVFTGKTAKLPEVTRPGYKLTGWEGDYTNVTENRTIKAKWEKLAWFTVTFDLAGGERTGGGELIQTVQEGSSPTFPVVRRNGYIFEGWDGPCYNITGNVTATARWKEIPRVAFIVRFDPAGGQFYNPGGAVLGGAPLHQHVDIGKSADLPNVMRPGYKFVGWDGDYTNVTSDRTIRAIWQKIEEIEPSPAPTPAQPTPAPVPTPAPTPATYTIKATAGAGGKVSGGGTAKAGQQVTLKATPKAGYYFTGWKEGKQTVSTSPVYSFKVAKNRTLTASFAKLIAPKLTVKSAGYDSVQLSFPKVKGATEYEIYYGASAKKLKKLKTVKATSAKTVTYTDKGRTLGKACYYKVRAKATGTATTYSPYSGVKSAKPALAKPEKLTAKAAAKKQVQLSWKKVSGASGYEVYRAASKSGKYKKVTTIKKGATVKYTDKKLAAGKTYYYKVRAYRTVKGKKVYSAYSDVGSVKAKK